jgi:CheY-like chemotaxis protein
MLFNQSDPWEPGLYDIVIPTDKMAPADAAILIADNAVSDVVVPTESSKQALADFRLTAATEVALAREGHNVDVSAEDGSITLTINKHVLMLSRLQEELRSIAEQIPGVKAVETRVGKDFHKSDIYRKHNFEMPSKVLLVDDEREFVQTLSERLLMRDLGPAVAYDGESALNLINEDEPDVMIVDLKMPGIDGLEVLRKVKQTRPEIEVIVLTGHGHEEDRELCMQLGAFAYLQKPLDINELSEIIKKANEKIQQKKAEKSK